MVDAYTRSQRFELVEVQERVLCPQATSEKVRYVDAGEKCTKSPQVFHRHGVHLYLIRESIHTHGVYTKVQEPRLVAGTLMVEAAPGQCLAKERAELPLQEKEQYYKTEYVCESIFH